MAEKDNAEKKSHGPVMPSLPVIDPVNIFGGEEAVEAAKKLLVDEFVGDLEEING